MLLFAVVISQTTVWILQGQARNEVDEIQLGAQTSRSLADLGQRLEQWVGQFRI